MSKREHLAIFMCRLITNSGSLNLLNPEGPVQACIRTASDLLLETTRRITLRLNLERHIDRFGSEQNWQLTMVSIGGFSCMRCSNCEVYN